MPRPSPKPETPTKPKTPTQPEKKPEEFPEWDPRRLCPDQRRQLPMPNEPL